MKQSAKLIWINSQLMKAHQFLQLAIDSANHFSRSERQQLGNVIMSIELIDIEILQLLNGQSDLELLFEEDE